jgi:DNA-binding NarL/FixJ family response regulator
MATPYRLLIADDHALVRDGLRLMLSLKTEYSVVGEACDGEAVLAQIDALGADLLLLDLDLPGLDGLSVQAQLRQRGWPGKVLVITGSTDVQILKRALASGAHGVFAKNGSASELIGAIEALRAGHSSISRTLADLVRDDPLQSLTPREREVLSAIGRGVSSKQIARELALSLGTVNKHRENLSSKLGARSAAELISFASKFGAHAAP